MIMGNRTMASRCLILLLMLGAGCNTLNLDRGVPERPAKDQVPGLPCKRELRISQFIFFSDMDIKRDQPIFRELSNLREQVYRELRLPSSTKLVHVYIFEDKDRYEKYMQAKYPDLPKRRAFFVAQPHNVGGEEDLLVYTYWGDRVREDLRHELTHALLHSVLKDVPLWLDEGLAEYFEIPPDAKGVNDGHLDQIRRAGEPFKPNLARLEQLSQVQQMTPAEYRESWAWVHLMLRGKAEGKRVLLDYLQQLRLNPNPGSMGTALTNVYPSPEGTLNDHLAHLDVGKKSAATAQK